MIQVIYEWRHLLFPFLLISAVVLVAVFVKDSGTT